MISKKTIINKTGSNLIVGVIVRNGDRDVMSDSRTQWTRSLADGDSVTVQLGPEGEMLFVNGLWLRGSGGSTGVGYRVLNQADGYDDTLNKNDTLTIGGFSAGSFDVKGSNTGG